MLAKHLGYPSKRQDWCKCSQIDRPASTEARLRRAPAFVDVDEPELAGDYTSAAIDPEKAIAIDPEDDFIQARMAGMLSTSPEIQFATAHAVELATRAVELTKRNDWYALESLAAAHAESEYFDSAVSAQGEAITVGMATPQRN